MKREFVRNIVVFEDHFIVFKKTLERGVLKKTQKAPQAEIDKAKVLMNKYFQLKNTEYEKK